MYDPTRDLVIVEAITHDLKDYLLSDTLYWSLSGGWSFRNSLPKGTLGALLMRFHRLTTLDHLLNPEQYDRLHTARETTEVTFDKWRVQVENKAVQEIKSRLRLWGTYLNECEVEARSYHSEYPTQVSNRLLLSFLYDYGGKAVSAESLTTRLTMTDSILMRISTDSDFIWEEALEPAYPIAGYGWLYRRIRR